MIPLRVLKNPAGVDLALTRADPVENGLFKLVVSVSAKHVALPEYSHAAFHIPHKLRRAEHRRDRKPLALAPNR